MDSDQEAKRTGPETQEGKIPLWLDCDPGHDDAFAILLAAHHPSLQLLGLSTVHGNAALEKTTNNARSILEAIGCSHVPVVPGAETPLSGVTSFAPEIHGASGLDGTDLLPRSKEVPFEGSALLEIRDKLMACPPDEAWLVTTGSLTNAVQLFTTFPEVAHHIRGLSIMGGAIGSDFTQANLGRPFKNEHDQLQDRIGNYTPYAEFNIWVDTLASSHIFSNPILHKKITLVTLDLSHQVLATAPVQEMILHGRSKAETEDRPVPSRLRSMFHQLLVFFSNTYSDVFGFSDGPPLHDPLAVAILLPDLQVYRTDGKHAEYQEEERFMITIQTTGQRSGQTVLSICADGNGVKIPRSIDVKGFWHQIDDCLERASEHLESGNLSLNKKS